MHSTLDSAQYPRLTGEVRVGSEVVVRIDACVSSPARRAPVSETFWKAVPVTPGMP